MTKSKLKKILIGDFTLKRMLYSIIFIYVALGLIAWFLTDRIIFIGRRSGYNDNEQGLIKITAKDGAKLSTLYIQKPQADFTILFSHGNAEDLGDMRPFLEELASAGFSVLAWDYRGYGTNPGRPTESNCFSDIETLYDYAVTELHIEPETIIAHGRSIGGAMAIHLSANRPVAGLIAESSFTAAIRVATRVPLYPFDKFRNIAKISSVNCPVLIIHGDADGIIPFAHGRRLYEKAREPKFSLWVEGAGHNDLAYVAGDEYLDALTKFADSVKQRQVAE